MKGFVAAMLVMGLWMLPASGGVLPAECGSLENKNGPHDYTSASGRENLPIVESAHFTTEIELLKGHNKCGNNGCQLRDDLDYTLRAFPNHHRALLAVINYDMAGMDEKLGRMRYTTLCYLERAVAFKSNDPTVRMIFGYYWSQVDEPTKALEEYERALRLAPDSAEVHYNLGLLYTDRGDYELARTHAVRAYQLGFPLPGLRAKLERVGQWKGLESELGFETDQQ